MVDPNQMQQDLLRMRMRNMFMPANVATPPEQTNAPPVNTPPAAPQLYKPQTAMMDNYTQMMQQMPQRANFQPSGLQRVGAAIAGMGGNRPAGMWGGQPVGYVSDPLRRDTVQQNILNRSFDKAMSDWLTAEKPAATAAGLEEARNRANQSYEVQQQKADTAAAREKDYQKRIEILEQEAKDKKAYYDGRIAAHKYQIEHPNWKSALSDDGQLVFYNPQNPMELKYPGIQQLTQEDIHNFKVEGSIKEIQARHQARLDEIGATGDEARKTVGAKEAADEKLEGVKETDREKLKATAPGKASTPPKKTTTVVKDAKGNTIGSKEVTTGDATPQLPAGFTLGQKIQSKDGRTGTLTGVNPDGTPKIDWDK